MKYLAPICTDPTTPIRLRKGKTGSMDRPFAGAREQLAAQGAVELRPAMMFGR